MHAHTRTYTRTHKHTHIHIHTYTHTHTITELENLFFLIFFFFLFCAATSIYLNPGLTVIKKHITSHFKMQLFYLIDFAARPSERKRNGEASLRKGDKFLQVTGGS
jgi:hypothetical protein